MLTTPEERGLIGFCLANRFSSQASRERRQRQRHAQPCTQCLSAVFQGQRVTESPSFPPRAFPPVHLSLFIGFWQIWDCEWVPWAGRLHRLERRAERGWAVMQGAAGGGGGALRETRHSSIDCHPRRSWQPGTHLPSPVNEASPPSLGIVRVSALCKHTRMAL